MNTPDIMYNVMLNTDSRNIQTLAVTNKSAKLIYDNSHFWKDLFKYRDIPISSVPSFDEFERYEKCYHIAKNILTLALTNRK